MRKLLIKILVLMILVSGCVYPVDDLDTTEDKLIVQCEFEPGSDILIYVFKGIGLPSNFATPEVPDSLDLKIFKSGTSLEIIRRIGLVPYFESRGLVSQGDQMTLSAHVPDGNPHGVYAETVVPYEAHAKELVVSSEVLPPGPQNVFSSLIELGFGFEDANLERFYEIEVFVDELAQRKAPGELKWEVFKNPVKLSHEETIPPGQGVAWLDSRGSFLVDFKKLDLSRRIKLVLPLENDDTLSGAKLRIIIKAHTEDGYRYLYTYNQTRYQYAAVNPVLISNIDNGIGCFIACTRTEKSMEVLFE